MTAITEYERTHPDIVLMDITMPQMEGIEAAENIVRQHTAVRVASRFAASELPESDELVRETVCELANQVTGNAITALNDQGFHFRVHPPVLHTLEHGSKSSEDTEALVICFETASGNVFMNIALRYNRRRQGERAAAAKQ